MLKNSQNCGLSRDGDGFSSSRLIIIRFLSKERKKKPVLLIQLATRYSHAWIEHVVSIILQVCRLSFMCHDRIGCGWNVFVPICMCAVFFQYGCLEAIFFGVVSTFCAIKMLNRIKVHAIFCLCLSHVVSKTMPAAALIVSITFAFFAKLTCDLVTMLHIDGHVSCNQKKYTYTRMIIH